MLAAVIAVVEATRSSCFSSAMTSAGGLAADTNARQALYDGALASKWRAVKYAGDVDPFALASAAILAAPLARSAINCWIVILEYIPLPIVNLNPLRLFRCQITLAVKVHQRSEVPALERFVHIDIPLVFVVLTVFCYNSARGIVA